MKPLLVLLALPIKRYPFAIVLMLLLMAGGWSLPFFIHKDGVLWAALGVHAYTLMFLSMLSAMVWSSICRPDTQLLPNFRGYFRILIALYLTVLVLLPCAIALIWGKYGVLVGGGLALIFALGMASGSGAKWAALVWMLPVLLGIWPEVRKATGYALIDTHTAPLLLFLVAAIVIYATWKRLTDVGDQAPTLSPADINVSDLRYGPEAVQAANAGKLGRWFMNRQQDASARAFNGILAALGRGSSSAAQRSLTMILMPNLHWRGVALEMLFTGLMVGMVGLLIGAQKGGPGIAPGLVATYVGVLTAFRFQGLHRATMMLRPSMTDVYLAMAPSSQLAFSTAVARALRPALISAMVFATTMLGVLLPFVAAPQRLPLLIGGLTGGFVSSLFGLGVVLMLLDAEKPRMISGMIVLGFGGSFIGSLCGAAFNASLTGGAAVGVALTVLMLGFVAHGNAYAQRWPIRFDAPV